MNYTPCIYINQDIYGKKLLFSAISEKCYPVNVYLQSTDVRPITSFVTAAVYDMQCASNAIYRHLIMWHVENSFVHHIVPTGIMF